MKQLFWKTEKASESANVSDNPRRTQPHGVQPRVRAREDPGAGCPPLVRAPRGATSGDAGRTNPSPEARDSGSTVH